MHIAPNSSFNANLLLGGKRLVPGRYTMIADFKSDQYQREIKKTVQITKTDARYINDHNAAYQKKTPCLTNCYYHLRLISGDINL